MAIEPDERAARMTPEPPDSATSSQTANAAYQPLKRDIVRGVHAPGQKLLMSDLKTRYRLGVGPLREALTRLVGEHLVTTVSQRGYRVAPISLPALAAIYDARAELESLLVRMAIERGDDAWEAGILASLHRLSKVTRLENAEQTLELWDVRHQTFHDAIVAGCDCEPLLQARAALFDQAQRYRHLWLCDTVFSETTLATKRAEHATLVDALLARDVDTACEGMRAHLMTPVPIIRERLALHRATDV